MRPERLRQYRVQRLEPGGVNTEPASNRLVLWGIKEGAGSEIGIQVGETYLERAPGEEVDILRIRAMQTVVPNLPPDALRDSKGSAVGYFLYPGLPPDHCKATAEREANL